MTHHPLPPQTDPGSAERWKKNILASLNHDLRTPLTGILGMLDLLAETTLDEEQREFVGSSRACAENLLESISNALEFAALGDSLQPGAESEFRLAEMFEAIVAARQPKAFANGLSISLLVDSAMPETAVGDALRIRKILEILISHAMQSTEEGEIEVVASCSDLAEDHLAQLTVSVRDSGRGIEPGLLSKRFSSGEGLESGPVHGGSGLPLAARICQLLGGHIHAESLPGEGSLFTFSVPLRLSAEAVPVMEDTSAAERAQILPHVLLVEDNEVAQRFMATMLERHGFRVTVAGGGQQAIDDVFTTAFDLILMDLQMPGVDGFTATREIRRLPFGAEVPILACTANPTSDVRSECVAIGMNGFLSKPVQSSELITVIGHHVGLDLDRGKQA